MNGMAELIAQIQAWAVLGGLVFLRIGAAAALLPVFGEQGVPVRVRLAAALAFSAVVAPAVAPSVQGFDGATLARAIGAEVLCGLMLGFGARMIFAALELAGAMIAQATTLAQMAGTAVAEPQPAIGRALSVAGLALAAAAGLHVRLAQMFILSYEVLPAGQFPSGADLSRWSLAQITGAFALGFSIAAPFLIAALLYNTAMGVLNRAMPQLMVSFVGAPLLTFGALALLVAVAPAALAHWLQVFLDVVANPFATSR